MTGSTNWPFSLTAAMRWRYLEKLLATENSSVRSSSSCLSREEKRGHAEEEECKKEEQKERERDAEDYN